MKIQIQWLEADVWKNAIVQLKSSRAGNLWFEHNGCIYVFKENKEGIPVLCKAINDNTAKWAKAGRITRYHQVFLGEGLSFSEYNDEHPMKWEKPVFA